MKAVTNGCAPCENALVLYVHPSHSNRQVILPTAETVGSEPENGPLVSFLDARGNVVAMFLRADVALYLHRNLGQALEHVEDPRKSEQTC